MENAYFVPQENLKKFCIPGVMGDQEGLYASFITDPEAVAALLPPVLTPASPVATLYCINMGKPSFASQYNEAALMVQAKYGDVVGNYFVGLMLSGPGAEMGMACGRDVFGLPKKLCDNISIRREGDEIHATVDRHDTRLLDVKMQIGECNDPLGTKIYSANVPGTPRFGNSLVFRYQVGEVDGVVRPSNMTLDVFESRTNYATWENASVEITLGSSLCDPWGALPVVKPLGGGYCKNENLLLGCKTIATPDADEVFPYIFKGFYDIGTLSDIGDQKF